MIAVRPAKRSEANSLTALCLRSPLPVGEEDIAAGGVLVTAEDECASPALVAVLDDGQTVDLQEMFVDPPTIGRGLGGTMVDAATNLARALGARRLTIRANVNAAAFYKRGGARFVAHVPSDAIPGRTLPVYQCDLLSGGAS